MSRIYLILSTVVILLVIGLVVGLRLAAPRQVTPNRGNEFTPRAPTADEQLEAVRDELRKANDYSGFLVAIQVLNASQDAVAGGQLPALTSEEQALLKGAYGLDESELGEVGHAGFTPLDGHHLDLCFLLRDAVRSLRLDKLPPLEQASAAFAWMVRQVRFVRRDGDLLPPQFILRRGWGIANERALVFLALLQQLGIDGCMVLLPAGQGQQGSRYWLPGALVGKQIYLFDTRLGLPLPGPNGKGIATLAQVKTQPELLKRLTVDARHAYDVTPEQAQAAEVHVACALSALAPRMRALQDLVASSEGVRLAVDPTALLRNFQAAVKEPGLTGTRVGVWNLPGDVNTPIRVLRRFLPEDEGGLDKGQQREFWKRQLIPWEAYPAELNKLPGEANVRLRGLFANPFLAFPLDSRLSPQILQFWLRGLAEPALDDRTMARRPAEVSVRDRMPRDLEIRGRFDEATNLLVAIDGELKRHINMVKNRPDLEPEVAQWCERAARAQNALLQAEQTARSPTRRSAADGGDREAARKEFEQVMTSSGAVMALVLAAVARPMSGEVTYLLALCKHEQAERAQARLADLRRAGKPSADAEAKVHDAWRSADGWWRDYLDRYGGGVSRGSALFHRAHVLLALGQRDEAISLLENVTPEMPELEQTGHLYLARQLKGQ